MSGSRLKRWRWRRALARYVDEDPRFRVSAHDGDWLCPYCGRVALGRVPAEERVDRVLDHLSAACPSWREFEGELLSVPQLRSLAEFYRLREQFQRDASWRVFEGGKKWVCPYCAETTALVFGGSKVEVNNLIRGIRKHLRTCHRYDPGQEPLDPGDLREQVARRTRLAEVAARIRLEMAANPRFRLRDVDKRWICPYCEQVISHIDLSTDLLERHTAPRQIAEHLTGACGSVGEGLRLQKTVQQLDRVVRRINEGKSARAPAKASAEDVHIRVLRAEIRRLKGEIRTNTELEKSLDKARRVQERMLPKLPVLPGYEFAVVYRPTSDVGGDFYDFVRVDERRIGIGIGDVSGHGIEAALVMGMAKKAMNLRGRESDDPVDVLRRLNQDVYPDLEPNTFVTIVYGVLDSKTHQLKVGRGGHNFPLHYKPGTRSVEVVRPRGLMVGINEGPVFEASLEPVSITLEPGDVFLLYTDGIVEAKAEGDVEYGLGALQDVVSRFGHFDAESLLGKIQGALREFTGDGPLADDVTLVAVRRKPFDENPPAAEGGASSDLLE